MARESSLTRGGRVAFGGLVEAVKATAGGGTKNGRGDFTVEELRSLASGANGVVVDRRIDRGKAVLELERAVRRLDGATVHRVHRSLDDAIELSFEHAILRLPHVGWRLRADGDELARGADEPAWAFGRLRVLEGRGVTRAGFRRRDRAVGLELDDDPFAASYELLVRGRDARPWSLITADGVRVGPGIRGLG